MPIQLRGRRKPSPPIFDDELKLAIAKLVCCGANGCMNMIQTRADDPARCWCEINDFKGSNTEITAKKIMELFR